MENVSFNGYNENVITLPAADGVVKGSIVKVSENYKVSNCTDGNQFLGVVVNIRGGYAAVQTKGYFKLKKAGSIGLGFQELAASSSTVIKALGGGVPCQVIAVDSKYVEFII